MESTSHFHFSQKRFSGSKQRIFSNPYETSIFPVSYTPHSEKNNQTNLRFFDIFQKNNRIFSFHLHTPTKSSAASSVEILLCTFCSDFYVETRLPSFSTLAMIFNPKSWSKFKFLSEGRLSRFQLFFLYIVLESEEMLCLHFVSSVSE